MTEENSSPLEVALDLVAMDESLREAVGDPVPVRISPDAVISVPHAKGWTHNGSRFLASGFWDAWAAEVLSEEDARAFVGAKLKNYQLDALNDAITAANGISAGKSAAILHLAKERRRELEPDLHRYFSLDLLDLYRPGGGASGLTPRKLSVLIDALPPDSMTNTKLRLLAESTREQPGEEPDDDDSEPYDPADGHWSHADMLLAGLIDEIRILRYVTIRAASAKGKPPLPDLVRRPGFGKKPVKTRKKRSQLTPRHRMAIDPRSPSYGQLPGRPEQEITDRRRRLRENE